MGKYDSNIIKKILCFRDPLLSFTYCGVVTEFTMLHLRCLKYMTRMLLIPVMMKMIIYLKALAVQIVW